MNTQDIEPNDITLIAALRSLANDIQSADGVANVVIAEAAARLRELTLDPHEPLNATDDRFWRLVSKLRALTDQALNWFRFCLRLHAEGREINLAVTHFAECENVGLMCLATYDGVERLEINADAVTLWCRCPHLFPGDNK